MKSRVRRERRYFGSQSRLNKLSLDLCSTRGIIAIVARSGIEVVTRDERDSYNEDSWT